MDIDWIYMTKSGELRVRSGKYYGKVKHTVGKGIEMAYVIFDRRKRVSQVPFLELEPAWELEQLTDKAKFDLERKT